MLSDKELTEITNRRIAAMAALGPNQYSNWEVGGPYPSVSVIVCTEPGCLHCECPEPPQFMPIATIHDCNGDFDTPPPEAAKDIAEFVAHSEQDILHLVSDVRELQARIRTLEQDMAKSNEDICQTLGKALGYPWYKDDQENFPGATEEQGVCCGDHVAESIAMGAASHITELEEGFEKFMSFLAGGEKAEKLHPYFSQHAEQLTEGPIAELHKKIKTLEQRLHAEKERSDEAMRQLGVARNQILGFHE